MFDIRSCLDLDDCDDEDDHDQSEQCYLDTVPEPLSLHQEAVAGDVQIIRKVLHRVLVHDQVRGLLAQALHHPATIGHQQLRHVLLLTVLEPVEEDIVTLKK